MVDGLPFDYVIYDNAKVNVLGVVQDARYAHPKHDASVTVDLPTHTAIVHLAFTTGPKCTFGTVEVQGVDGELRDAVLARLQFHPGQTYSSRAVTATQRELYGFGRFSTVQVQPDAGDGAVVNMKVAVSRERAAPSDARRRLRHRSARATKCAGASATRSRVGRVRSTR